MAQDQKVDTRLKVFIQGPGAWGYMQMFLQNGFMGAKSVSDADIICFTGGEDVSPSLYGEKALPRTSFNPKRDGEDQDVYWDSLFASKFMVGICRGGQFLNVANGGKMWQDVDNHTSPHELLDLRYGERIYASSTHHQQMRPHTSGTVIAEAASIITTYKIAETDTPESDDPDVEVVLYEDTGCLCFQPHPELPGKQYDHLRAYFFDLLRESYDNYQQLLQRKVG